MSNQKMYGGIAIRPGCVGFYKPDPGSNKSPNVVLTIYEKSVRIFAVPLKREVDIDLTEWMSVEEMTEEILSIINGDQDESTAMKVESRLRVLEQAHLILQERCDRGQLAMGDAKAALEQVPVLGEPYEQFHSDLHLKAWDKLNLITLDPTDQNPLHDGAEQLGPISLVHSGRNPQGFTADVVRSGDPGIYDELRLGVYRGGNCVADVLVGLNEAGEPRILCTVAGNGNDGKQIAIFPLREEAHAVSYDEI